MDIIVDKNVLQDEGKIQKVGNVEKEIFIKETSYEEEDRHKVFEDNDTVYNRIKVFVKSDIQVSGKKIINFINTYKESNR